MLIMNIGLPGVGKSSLLERLGLPASGFYVVSTDRIRYEFFGVVFARKVEPQVWAIARALVEGNFRLGRSVVLDFTNLTIARRRQWIELAKKYGQKILGIFYEVPFEQARARNRKRPREWVVPDEVLQRMLNSLQLPSPGEGFHALVTVHGSHDEAGVQQVKEAVARLSM